MMQLPKNHPLPQPVAAPQPQSKCLGKRASDDFDPLPPRPIDFDHRASGHLVSTSSWLISSRKHDMRILRAVTLDDFYGQPWPPPDRDVLWKVVRRAGGRTLWRAIKCISPSMAGEGGQRREDPSAPVARRIRRRALNSRDVWPTDAVRQKFGRMPECDRPPAGHDMHRRSSS